MAVRLAQAGAAFCGAAAGAESDAAADALVKIIAATGSGGKENAAATKQHRATALECLKSAAAKLGEPRNDARRTAAACRALLDLLQRSSSGSAAAAAQLHTSRYNVARRLVSARAFADAFAEASLLHQALKEQQEAGKKSKGAPSVDAANLAVGTALTLALCWAEGGAAGGGDLDRVLEAAQGAEAWLR
jgi:hypothetical protein